MAKDKATPPRHYFAWMAVGPKTGKPWSEPWVYIRKTKPLEIEYSGHKAVRVKIEILREGRNER